ncbi:MAG: DUF4340 domain-containing protein [Sandaracinaceae bacterium]|nr:DUF4340 domain-containing protein [Sandaracinaceae bacterium]
MSKRTALILASIAAALLVAILATEIGSLSSTELRERRGRVLSSFVRRHVTRVSVQRADEPVIVLERSREEQDELGTWRLTAPVRAAADEDAVDGLLGALEWLQPERTLQNIGAEDRRRFGLEEPRFVVGFHAADREVSIRVGGEDPRGQGVYVLAEEPSTAYIVGRDFVEAIDHDASHFRSKELFAGVRTSDAERVVVTGGEARVELARVEGVWSARAPVAGLASSTIVDGLLRVPGAVEAARFEAESPRELARYGLEPPWRELVIERPASATGERRARLRVGAVCGEHAEERYAIAGDGGPVVCVAASDVSALDVDTERLRELRPITTPDDAVERVEVARAGHRLELRREEAEWRVVVDGGAPQAADPTAVSAWLGELRRARAEGFDPLPASLPEATATLTIHRAEDGGEEVLRIVGDVEGGVSARRGEEGALARFPAALDALVQASALRFRDRALLTEEAGQARSLRVVASGAEQRAIRDAQGTWQLEAPLASEADRVGVRELIAAIASLRAERFAGEQAQPEHGLSEPAVRLEVRFEPAEGQDGGPYTRTLRVGAATEGGAFAQLDDRSDVFVIASSVVDLARRPLLSLDLLAIPTESITALRLERGDRVTELTRQGDAWTAGGQRADGERVRALFDRIATLRASSVRSYGGRVEAPAVRLRITRREGDPITLELGAAEGDAVPAHRDGIDALFVVRADVLRTFESFEP